MKKHILIKDGIIMETRCNNLVYEHKHDGYGWHPNARIHKKRPVEMLEICTGCSKVGKDLIYDEYIDRFLCDRCDMKNEIRKLDR